MKNLGLFLAFYVLSVPALSESRRRQAVTLEQQRQEEASENLLERGIKPHNIGTGSGYGYYPETHGKSDKKVRDGKKKDK